MSCRQSPLERLTLHCLSKLGKMARSSTNMWNQTVTWTISSIIRSHPIEGVKGSRSLISDSSIRVASLCRTLTMGSQEPADRYCLIIFIITRLKIISMTPLKPNMVIGIIRLTTLYLRSKMKTMWSSTMRQVRLPTSSQMRRNKWGHQVFQARICKPHRTSKMKEKIYQPKQMWI